MSFNMETSIIMNAFYNPQTKYERAVLESHCWSVNSWFDSKVCYKFAE